MQGANRLEDGAIAKHVSTGLHRGRNGSGHWGLGGHRSLVFEHGSHLGFCHVVVGFLKDGIDRRFWSLNRGGERVVLHADGGFDADGGLVGGGLCHLHGGFNRDHRGRQPGFRFQRGHRRLNRSRWGHHRRLDLLDGLDHGCGG